MHTVDVADTFVAVKLAEREGWLKILTYGIEADTWVDIAGAQVHPDMYLELGLIEKRQRVVLWIEVDRGGEREKQINTKLDRYAYAYQHSDSYPRDIFPSVVFLASDEERLSDLRLWVGRTAGLADGLITVEKLENFPQSLR
jgi:hypothetical protein